MEPPAPFPPPPPGPGYPTPARAAAALASQLTQLGVTGIYTAAAEKFAIISVTADVTVWTDGRLIWCTHRGQRHTWPAGHAAAAAARLAALAAT
jgi:hypothetical protein